MREQSSVVSRRGVCGMILRAVGGAPEGHGKLAGGERRATPGSRPAPGVRPGRGAGQTARLILPSTQRHGCGAGRRALARWAARTVLALATLALWHLASPLALAQRRGMPPLPARPAK